ncbi:chemotaxis protein CheA [Clostridium aestuarii]|uniref:histidine kinase n=1 Tax=Clostridium aestuarii TaxID=338193 RepID=A0ABT4CV80_9CLOT|nr:chemotaxis protein CheA [Clostridium aestuarii]MCY6482876.1 chemotaxis protein CheA [Clostridium aestuarii]
MINEEFINDFIEEAKVHTSNVEKCLLQLNDEKENVECINKIFRAVHSIKGTAGFFKLDKIVELAHSMENLFGKIRNNKYKLNDRDIDILLSANDCLKTLSENVYDNENVNVDEYITKINNILQLELQILQGNKEKENLDICDINTNLDNYNKNFHFEKIDYEIIRKAKKIGHMFYEISINLMDLKENNIEIMELIECVKSIGEIIDSNIDTSKIIDLEKLNKSEDRLYLLVSSILEKELILLALNLDEIKIHEYTIEDNIKFLEEKDNLEVNNKNVIEVNENNNQKQNPDKSYNQIALTEEYEDVYQKEKNIIKQKNSQHKEESIRVKLSLLNDLLNLTGELVLGRNQLLRSMENHKKDIQGVDGIIQHIDYLTSNLQEKVMQTRMQPIANIFDKFPRIIRDLSKSLNKDIKLEIEGGEVELDKSIIEALSDPLTHLVRNAADHGLENSTERLKKGKPDAGNVRLKAYYRAGYVIIDVKDDGKGIDIEKIKTTALEKKLVSPNELLLMTEKEIIELILIPGFSTIENVTNISGRGVGMDVVKTNIKKLGGNIEIYTKKEKETTVRLIIPLTLAIISSLIVESKNQKFVLPQINLKEIVRVTSKDKNKRIEQINDSKVLKLRNKFLPIVNLTEILEGKCENSCEGCSDKIIRILVLKIGFKEFGLIVDEIQGREEILVKSLPKYIKDSNCYSGVTILGDGKVAMILDVNGIIQKAKLKLKDESELIKLKIEKEKNENIEEKRKIILFKCSQYETIGLDLSFIKRVEEIQLEDIELIGDKEYVKIMGNPLRIIRPSDYIPISKQQKYNKKYYVIMLKGIKYPAGILIDKIYDAVEMHMKLNNDEFNYKGILGSAIIENKITLILNIYELLEMAAPEKYKIETVRTQLEKEG